MVTWILQFIFQLVVMIVLVMYTSGEAYEKACESVKLEWVSDKQQCMKVTREQAK